MNEKEIREEMYARVLALFNKGDDRPRCAHWAAKLLEAAKAELIAETQKAGCQQGQPASVKEEPA